MYSTDSLWAIVNNVLVPDVVLSYGLCVLSGVSSLQPVLLLVLTLISYLRALYGQLTS